MTVLTHPLSTRTASSDEAIPFTRLVAVELRKAINTRTTRWLLWATVLLSLLVAGVQLAVSLGNRAVVAPIDTVELLILFPLGVLVPVLGILLVTSEWGHRTALTTFTLESRRWRVMAAKLVTAIVVPVVAFVAAVGLALAGAAVHSATGGAVIWSMPVDEVAALLGYHVIGVLLGFGFGVLTRNGPAALVSVFVAVSIIPAALSLVAGVWSWAEPINRWLNFSDVTAALRIGSAAEVQWSALAATIGVWIVAPILVGFRRIETTEIK
jgi:hypothetical protein